MLLGIDLGTTSVKALLVGSDGVLHGSGRVSHPTRTVGERAEQDPSDWWAGVVSAVRQALVEADGHPGAIAGIAVAGQGPTTVAVDASGAHLAPAITWQDTRASSIADELSDTIGVPVWHLGSLPHERWLALHEPAVHARGAAFLSSWDWLTGRLSGWVGRSVPPVSLHPTDDVLRAGGGDPVRFGARLEWGTRVGGLLPGPAAELGLTVGTPVVSGGNDALASFHGAGLVEPGDAVDAGGTAGGLGVYWDEEIVVPGTYRAPAALPGLWLYGGAMNAVGKSVDWVMGILAPRDTAAADGLIAAAFATPVGAEGLVFLPYLAGERAPIDDVRARGVLAGLSLGHGAPHIVRAVLEAGGYALRHVAEPIAGAGIHIRRLVVSGASERLRPIAQMRADTLGVPVDVPALTDTAAVGAAILAATGIGIHPDARIAIREMVRIAERAEPRAEACARHDEVYGVYRALYPATADLQHRLADLGDAADRR
jgi:sugar (pentulose or hexulose) kinase